MDPKPITIFKGDDSTAFGVRTINVKLSTDLDLTNATAKFDLLSYHKSFNAEATATKVFSVEFSAEETKKLPIGVVYGNLRIFDSEGKVLTAACHIPFEVRYPGREGSCDWKKYGCPVSVEVFLGIDYKFVFNKPTINGVPVVGDKDAHDYGIAKLSDIPTIPEQNDGTARPLPDYLYALDFADPYFLDAMAFYEEIDGLHVLGGCSIVRKDDLIGCNFDYPYDESASFVVRMSALQNRHASVGMAYVGQRLTDRFVRSGKFSEMYRVLPGMTESGTNDAGVFAKINVIPRDLAKDPTKSETRDLHALMVVRYVLDNFDSAREAAMSVAESYYIPDGSADSYHWMIADANGTWIVEDGHVNYTAVPPDETVALTNYRVLVAYPSQTGTRYGYDPEYAWSEDPFGSGKERLDYLLSTDEPVTTLTEATKFTNAYANGWPWPSEFAGQRDSQGRIPNDAMERLRAWATEHITPLLNAERKPAARGNGCWQTVHSSIYSLQIKALAVCVQEDFSKRYTFALGDASIDAYTKSEMDALLATKYTKPTGGIPKSDLASGVQTSLGKADAAAPQATTYTKNETDAAIIGNVENSTTSTSITKALSANMGKELQDQIQNLKQRGRYLSIWDCSIGLAKTVPTVNPYEYKAGDYFIIGEIAATGGTNYRPSGTHYDKDVPSTTVETGTPVVNDTYYYDGSSWSLLHTQQAIISWDSVANKPSTFPPSAHSHAMSEVTGLADALGKKVDAQLSETIPAGAYTFTNGKNGWQAWAWKDENDEWHCVSVNTPQSVVGPVFNPDPYALVRFYDPNMDDGNNALYIYNDEDGWTYDTVFVNEYMIDGNPPINAVTDAPLQVLLTSFTDNLTTTAAKTKIVEAMPAPINPAGATTSGKAADALAVKNALAGKLDKTDVIKQSQVTSSTPYGKAADAKDMNSALAGKLNKTDVVNPNPPLGNYDNPLLSGKAADELAVRNKFTFRPYFKVKIERQGSKLIWANVKEDGAFVLVEYIFDTSPDITTQWFGYATSFYKTAVDPDTGEVIIQKEVPGNIITQNDVTIQWWPQGYSVDNGYFVNNRMLADLLTKFAPAYSTTTSYAVDDFCSYDGKIYQCIAATSGAWYPSDWAERNLSSLFSNDNGKLLDLIKANASSKMIDLGNHRWEFQGTIEDAELSTYPQEEQA